MVWNHIFTEHLTGSPQRFWPKCLPTYTEFVYWQFASRLTVNHLQSPSSHRCPVSGSLSFCSCFSPHKYSAKRSAQSTNTNDCQLHLGECPTKQTIVGFPGPVTKLLTHVSGFTASPKGRGPMSFSWTMISRPLLWSFLGITIDVNVTRVFFFFKNSHLKPPKLSLAEVVASYSKMTGPLRYQCNFKHHRFEQWCSLVY